MQDDGEFSVRSPLQSIARRRFCM